MTRELENVRQQLALELRADALTGRGQLPRDKSGRVSPGFLQEARSAGGLESLGAILSAAAGADRAPVLIPAALRVARLEQLESELATLLSSSAPRVWLQIRQPLRRLLRRARLELRALERGGEISTS